MFTIIGARAEPESSLISERVTAGMRAAEARGRHLGRPPVPARTIREIESLAASTELSVRQIQKEIAGKDRTPAEARRGQHGGDRHARRGVML